MENYRVNDIVRVIAAPDIRDVGLVGRVAFNGGCYLVVEFDVDRSNQEDYERSPNVMVDGTPVLVDRDCVEMVEQAASWPQRDTDDIELYPGDMPVEYSPADERRP